MSDSDTGFRPTGRATWTDVLRAAKALVDPEIGSLVYRLEEGSYVRDGYARRFVVFVYERPEIAVTVTGHGRSDWIGSWPHPLDRYQTQTADEGVIGDWISLADLPAAIAEQIEWMAARPAPARPLSFPRRKEGEMT
jgi:hypothetical protein